MADIGGFIAELKRRNVIRMAGLYLVSAWLVVQVGATLLPVFDAPAWTMKALVLAEFGRLDGLPSGIELRLRGRRRGLCRSGIGLGDLQIHSGLVRQLHLQFHPVLEPLNVPLGARHQTGQAARFGGRGGGLIPAGVELVVARVRGRWRDRGGRYRSKGRQGQ